MITLGSLRRLRQVLGWGSMVQLMEEVRLALLLILNVYNLPVFFTKFSGRICLLIGKIYHVISKISTQYAAGAALSKY